MLSVRNKTQQHADNPITSVVCIVKKEGKYLFCKREDNSLWVLPGGKIEGRETLEDAIRREVLEETGIRISKLKYRAKWKIPSFGEPQFIGVFESTGKISGNLTPSWESPEVAFLNNPEIATKVPEYIQDLLKKLNSNQNFQHITANNFEIWVIVHYIYGKIKRFLRRK